MALTQISTNGVKDGSLKNADVASDAAIALSKLATGALPSGLTVASANITDGTIVNADINSSAAIALSKISISGTGSSSNYLRGDGSWQAVPAGISLSGSTDNTIATVTGANALQGEANLTFNGSTLGVTGDITVTGTVDGIDVAALNTTVGTKAPLASPTFTGTVTTSSLLHISGTEPRLQFTDTNNNPDFTLWANAGKFTLSDETAGESRLTIDSSGNIGLGNISSPLWTTGGGLHLNDNYFIGFGNGGSGRPDFQIGTTGGATLDFRCGFGGDTVDLAIDTSGRFGINQASPTAKLHIVEATSTPAVKIKSGTSTNQNTHITLYNDNDGGTLAFGVFGSSANTHGAITATDGFVTSNQELVLCSQNNSGAIKFGVGSTPTEKLRIASNGRINIGNRTTSPDELVHIHTSSGEANIHLESATNANLKLRAHSGDSTIQFSDGSASNVGNINYDHGADLLTFRVNNSDRLGITNDGQILLAGATTSTAHADADDLVLNERAGGNVGMTFKNAGTGFGVIYFADNGSQHSGRIQYDHSNDSLDLFTAGSEKLTIASDGTATFSGTVSGTFSGSGASLTSLAANQLSSGTVPTARLGSGTANSSTYLRGDSTWATVAAGVTINNQADNRIITSTNTSNSLYAEGSFTFDGTDVDVATTGSVGLPEGTTAQRGSNVNGKIRYNSTTKSIEGHADGSWGVILTTLGTSTNPYASVAEAQANNQAEGLTYFKNSGGTAQQVYYDNSDGGWILVASNHVSESTIPSGTSRNNLSYTLHRNGTNGHLGTANPSKDYIIGNWYMTFSYSRCRGIGYGRNSTSTSYTWTNRGDWVSAQFAVTSRDTIVGESSVTWTSSRGDNMHNDANYWSIDGIWSDYRNDSGISANANQTTIGIVGVANNSGSPQYGCYYGHGNNEGNHEGWYDGGGGNMNSSGYTTWLR